MATLLRNLPGTRAIRDRRSVRPLPVLVLCLVAGRSADAADGRIPIYPVTSPATYPIQINAAGSYYLTDDIVTAASAHVIEVWASNVTIDLNGHRIEKTTTSNYLIMCAVNYTGLRVTNGSLLGGSMGIYFSSSTNGATLRADHLTVSGQGSYGIYVTGSAANVIATITDNTVSATNTGIYLSYVMNALVLQNVIKGGTYGLRFVNTTRATIRENTVAEAANYGIMVDAGSVSNRLEANIATGSTGGTGTGIYALGSVNTIVGNQLSDNVNGLVLLDSDDNDVSANNVSANEAVGIYVQHSTGDSVGNNIHHNSVSGNGQDGITITSSCPYNTVQYNTVSKNGAGGTGSGIHVHSDDNTIDWNSVGGNATNGVRLESTADYNIVTFNRGPGNGGAAWLDLGGPNNVFTNNLP